MSKKGAARIKTPDRILATALMLFNEEGEPNVTTNHIADEMDISPGNLHYHFRSKSDIIEALFQRFEHEISQLLVPARDPSPDLENAWLQLHLLFECMWSFRFVYRDLAQLLSKYPSIQRKTTRLLHRKISVTRQGCESFGLGSGYHASDCDIDALARNIVLVMTYWLSFETACGLESGDSERFGRGAYQVMSMLLPYLEPDARQFVHSLSREYV